MCGFPPDPQFIRGVNGHLVDTLVSGILQESPRLIRVSENDARDIMVQIERSLDVELGGAIEAYTKGG